MPKIFSSLFLLSLLAYFVFAGIEEFIPGFVSNYLSPHWLLIPVIVFLVAMMYKEREPVKPVPLSGVTAALLIFLASLATLTILWAGGSELQTLWRTLVAVYGGLLVAGMLTVLLKE